MTSNWQAPSNAHPYLTLPNSKISIVVPASPEFIDIWTNGPKQSTVESLGEALYTLTLSLGELIRQGQGSLQIFEKEVAQDYVTNVDLGIEWLIRDWFKRFRPDDRIVGEEGTRDSFEFDDVVWFIDPIDGTSNFIDGSPNVTVHIGSIYQGMPWVSVIGFPIAKNALVTINGRHWGNIDIDMNTQSQPRLGTEYRTEESPEAKTMDVIATQLNRDAFRVKSIGVNVLGLATGVVDIFYKPKAKYWDVIAPTGAIAQLFPGRFKMSVTYIDADGQRVTHPLFGFGRDVITYINARHQLNCRVGLVIIVPADATAVESKIIEEVNRCMSLSC